MLDSWGRIPNGIISGTVLSLGDYDQCVDIENIDIRGQLINGKYCLLKIMPQMPTKGSLINLNESVYANSWVNNFAKNNARDYSNIWNSICIPSVCTESEIILILQSGK